MKGMKGKRGKKEPAGMNIAEIFAALELLEKERNIPRDFMLEKIIQAIIAAYKKDHPGIDTVTVDADIEAKTLKMFVEKAVVDEEDYVDPGNEVSLPEAKALSARYEIGDVVRFPVDNVEFGRIAAGNGKQVIIQGLREAERGMVYDEYNSKQHEILTGTVVRMDSRTNGAIIRMGAGTEATEAILMPTEMIPGEDIREDMRLKVYVADVRRTTRGPQIVISRSHPGLVRRLFELEVPEISDGTVEIRSHAREAGSRTKIAVWSNDPNVDPVGACVGPKGQRVANIVEELRGEKIDIIKYSDDPAQYVAAALAPAEVKEVFVAPEGKACQALVPDDQLSLAIGREGQNARLAARLTGYKIDIKPLSYKETEEFWAEAAERAARAAVLEETAKNAEENQAAEKSAADEAADAVAGEAAATDGINSETEPGGTAETADGAETETVETAVEEAESVEASEDAAEEAESVEASEDTAEEAESVEASEDAAEEAESVEASEDAAETAGENSYTQKR